MVKRLAQGKPLNRPWGLALALKTFGTLGGALLVSNNTTRGNGNGYNMKTGKLMGTVKNAAGKAIAINGLRGIEFGAGSSLNGKTNQLFFTAGPSGTNVYFGELVVRGRCCQ